MNILSRAQSYRRLAAGLARTLIPASALLLAATGAAAQDGAPLPVPASAAKGQFDFAGWDAYLGGSDSSQFSSLTQINRDNVNQLEVAWEYPTGAGQPQLFNPIVVHGIMYVMTGSGKIAALNPPARSCGRARRRAGSAAAAPTIGKATTGPTGASSSSTTAWSARSTRAPASTSRTSRSTCATRSPKAMRRPRAR